MGDTHPPVPLRGRGDKGGGAKWSIFIVLFVCFSWLVF